MIKDAILITAALCIATLNLHYVLLGLWLNYLGIASFFTLTEIVHLISNLLFGTLCYLLLSRSTIERKFDSWLPYPIILAGVSLNIILAPSSFSIMQLCMYPIGLLWVWFISKMEEKPNSNKIWALGTIVFILAAYIILKEFHIIAQALGTFYQFSKEKLFASFAFTVHLFFMFCAVLAYFAMMNKTKSDDPSSKAETVDFWSHLIVSSTGWTAFVVIYRIQNSSIFPLLFFALPAVLLQLILYQKLNTPEKWKFNAIMHGALLILLCILYFLYYLWEIFALF